MIFWNVKSLPDDSRLEDTRDAARLGANGTQVVKMAEVVGPTAADLQSMWASGYNFLIDNF